MKGDLVSINGKLCRHEEVPMSLDALMSANFTYQRIHAIGRRALHVSTHAELSNNAYRSLYGSDSGITAQILGEETSTLLEANRYSQGSVTIMLYLMPGETGQTLRILSCEKQLLYKGYTLWHAAERAIVVPYEYPFPHFKTAVSLAATSYATQYARRKGAAIAISENHEGILFGIGDEPLFAVIGNTAITTSVGQGACDSVERRLTIAACERAGMEIVETLLSKRLLAEYQELFAVTPGGITSIKECGGNIYPNSTANRVAAAMQYFHENNL